MPEPSHLFMSGSAKPLRGSSTRGPPGPSGGPLGPPGPEPAILQALAMHHAQHQELINRVAHLSVERSQMLYLLDRMRGKLKRSSRYTREAYGEIHALNALVGQLKDQLKGTATGFRALRDQHTICCDALREARAGEEYSIRKFLIHAFACLGFAFSVLTVVQHFQ